jgi:hypothetical protein
MNEDGAASIEKRRAARRGSAALHTKKVAFRIITVERDRACGAAAISKKLSDIVGWKLGDQLLTHELADSIRGDLSTVDDRAYKTDERFCHPAQTFCRDSL